jgi:tetratricopeptide (TPR) repeat protein
MNASPAGTRSSQHPRIRELVDRLVELAPDSSYANGWLYFFAMEKRELQAAALFLERAIAGGRDANVQIMQGFTVRLLANMGRFDEAIALARYIVDRDPACTVCAQVLGFVLRQAGRPRETAQALQDLLEWREATPTWHWYMGVARLVSGDAAAALEHFEQTAPRQREVARLLALHDLERHAEFEAGFAKLRADPQRGPEAIARIAAWTGQNDLAFEYLERMVDAEGPESALWVSTDLYEPIKSDPRWRAFLERNDATGDEWSSIRFNPKLPAEVVKALATTD